MYVKKAQILLGVLLLMAISCYGARLLWWTTGSQASTGGSNTGTTMGQSIIGRQYDGTTTYGFWWNQPEPVICVLIDEENWFVDSVDIMETVTMINEETIRVSNCGNCHQNYGLEYIESSPLIWNIGYSSGANRFVMRAKFLERFETPSGFDHSRDYIKDVVSWAHGVSFGEDGFDVPSGDDRTMWLQFISPDNSTLYGANTITITLYCQVNLH